MMSEKDKESLIQNNICVVEADDPSLVKFVDSIPAIASRTEIEQAAIQLSRKVLNRDTWSHGSDIPKEAAKMFIDILIKGTPLDPRGTQKEQEERLFTDEKQNELRRLAREEAKAERLAAKESRQKKQP